MKLHLWFPVFLFMILPSNLMAQKFDETFYSQQSAREMAVLLAFDVFYPISNSLYQSDWQDLSDAGIDVDDVVMFSASCQTSSVQANTSKLEAAVVHFIWSAPRNRSGAKTRKIKRTFGEQTYGAALEAFAGAANDCIFATHDYIDNQRK